jgi:biotin operon repressor
MTIGDAAKKYLTMAKATKSTADIAAALERGGLKHSSKDFQATVRAILGQSDDFVRVPNGEVGLAEWYPGMGRGKKGKTEKSGKAAKRRKVKPPSKSRNDATLEDRILKTMKGEANKDWGSAEIATALDAKRESVQSTMSRLAKAGDKVTKADKGYRLVKLGIAAA